MTNEIKQQINDCMYRHTIAKSPAAKNRLMRLAEELEYLAYVQEVNDGLPTLRKANWNGRSSNLRPA